MVFAGSFSQTYKRNAINNGFIVIEAPSLLGDLINKFGDKKLTVRTGFYISVNFKSCHITYGNKQYNFSPVGTAAQELILSKGLENWVKEKI